jgi:hypothetical protein
LCQVNGGGTSGSARGPGTEHRCLALRLWSECRPELALLLAGSIAAAVAWGATSRPMSDTATYRAAARGLAEGWPSILDRTPGYPLLLLATGSSMRSTVALFLVQLALHVLCVVLVLDLARSCGVGRRGRLVLVLLLLAPAVLLRVLLEGSEAIAAALVTVIAWILIASGPTDGTRLVRRGLVLGSLCGMAALVRPTYALLAVPVALLAARMTVSPGHRRRRTRMAVCVAVAVPGVVIVGGYVLLNAIRFDDPTLTPLAPYHLSSRTSAYVEELPESYEPARSVLVRGRDRALLKGEEWSPENFIWSEREELSRVTGLSGRDLDRYVLEMDVVLITRNPFGYLDAVLHAATTNYILMDSQPAILGLGRPAAWVMALVHWGLLAATAAVVVSVPGLWLAGLVGRRRASTLAVVSAIAVYNLAVSVLVESGTARLRAPTEPLLALALVVGVSTVSGAVRRRRSTGPLNDRSNGATVPGTGTGLPA